MSSSYIFHVGVSVDRLPEEPQHTEKGQNKGRRDQEEDIVVGTPFHDKCEYWIRVGLGIRPVDKLLVANIDVFHVPFSISLKEYL